MSGVIGTEWLNSNSLRNYPLSQSATVLSTDSAFSVPDSFLVDMKLAVPYIPGLHPSDFYISSITVYSSRGILFEIGCAGTINVPKIAVSSPISFFNLNALSYLSVPIKGVSSASAVYDFSQVFGTAVVGSSAGFEGVSGTFTFSPQATRLESTVVSMGPRRLTGIRVVGSGFTTPVLSGQIYLSSGSNHAIAVNVQPSYTDLKFNAIDGDGLAETCECNDVELSPCIRTINNIRGDAQGNIAIVGGDCINIATDADGIVVSDTCAKPCCGCNELQVVVSDVEALTSQLDLLQNQITLLASSVTQLQNICLASSIDPTSCAQDNE
jgi:hypothetical protein